MSKAEKKNNKGKKNILYFIAKFILHVIWLVFPYKIVGRENLYTDDPVLISCNHLSYMDPVFIVLAMKKRRKIYFLAKSEIFKNKFISGFFRFCGAIPIDRKNGIQGIRSAVDKLESGNVVGIFPEGTRSKTGKLGKPKSGIIMVAQRCKSDIIPVTLVTKHQKVRPFRRTVIYVGERIEYEKLGIDSDSSISQLKAAGELIFEDTRRVLAQNTGVTGISEE